jgi:hypothetical protein
VFAAQGTDVTSGMDAATATWNWGDGTATSKGFDASHAFAGPGTYLVRFSVADAAGNVSETTREVKVAAAGGGPVLSGSTTTGGGTTTSGGTATGGGEVRGRGTPATTPLKVTVRSVPKRTGRRVLRLGVTSAAGTVRVSLRRGGRVALTRVAKVTAGKVAVTLPKKLAAGSYVVEVSAGERVGMAAFRLAGRKVRARAAAAARQAVDGLGIRTLPGLPG